MFPFLTQYKKEDTQLVKKRLPATLLFYSKAAGANILGSGSTGQLSTLS